MVDAITRDISDESQVAFSELGLDFLTTTGHAPAAVMATGGQPGGRSRIMETVQLDLPDAGYGPGRRSVAIQALIDTGADVSCISQALAENLGIEPRTLAITQITGAGGVTTATALPELTARIRNYTLQVQFLMLPLS